MPTTPLLRVLAVAALPLCCGLGCGLSDQEATTFESNAVEVEGAANSGASTLYLATYVRRWLTQSQDGTENAIWTDLSVFNLDDEPATVDLYVYVKSGSSYHLNKTATPFTIPARGAYRSQKDTTFWPNVVSAPGVDCDVAPNTCIGWVKVVATNGKKLFASSRNSVRAGSTEAGELLKLTEVVLTSNQTAATGQTLHAPSFVWNVATAGGLKQYTNLLLVNPSDTQSATARITVYQNDGTVVSGLQDYAVTVPARGRWTTNGDSNFVAKLNAAPGGTVAGWARVSVTSAQAGSPLFATATIAMSTASSGAYVTLTDATPLARVLASTVYASRYARNVTLSGGYKENTYLAVVNTSSQAVNVTLELYSDETGALLQSLPNVSVPARQRLRPSFSASDGTRGYVRISTSSSVLVGSTRIAVTNPATPSGPLVAFRDEATEPAPTQAAPLSLSSPLFFSRWYSGARSQWAEVRVCNVGTSSAQVFISVRTAATPGAAPVNPPSSSGVFDHTHTYGMVGSLFKTLPAKRCWSSENAADRDWLRSLPPSRAVTGAGRDPTQQRLYGWVQVESRSSSSILLTTRTVIRSTSDQDSAVFALDEVAAVQNPLPAVPATPHVVMMLVDDLDDFSYRQALAGGLLPNLQAVRGEGLEFPNSAVVNSLCCPSRAVLLSGQYGHNSKVRHNHPYAADAPATGEQALGGHAPVRLIEHRALPVLMHDRGYRTAYFGKYVNGYPAVEYQTYTGVASASRAPAGWETWDTSTNSAGALGGLASPFLNSSDARPMFLVLAPGEPHVDVPVARSVKGDGTTVIDQYRHIFRLYIDAVPNAHRVQVVNGLRAGTITLPETLPSFNEAAMGDKPSWMRNGLFGLGALPSLSPSGAPATETVCPISSPRWTANGAGSFWQDSASDTDAFINAWSSNGTSSGVVNEVCYLRRQYIDRLASLIAVDQLVGTVRSTLVSRGVYDNTLFLFTSDNGYLQGQHRYASKRMPYEQSLLVPLVLKRPGTTTSGSRAAIALNVDWGPTLLDYAGVRVNHSGTTPSPNSYPTVVLDGRSLRPVLEQPTAAWRARFAFENDYMPFAAGVLTQKKLWEVPTYVGVRERSSAGNDVFVRYTNGGSSVEREYYDLATDPHQLSSNPGASRASTLETYVNALAPCVGNASGGASCFSP